MLSDVAHSVQDWRKMVRRMEDSLKELDTNIPGLDPAEVTEARDFLRWLINNNFTFLGARDFRLIGDGTNRALQAIPGTGLGVLREESTSIAAKSYAKLPPQAQKMALSMTFSLSPKPIPNVRCIATPTPITSALSVLTKREN